MPVSPDFTIGGRSLVREALVETGFYRGATTAAALRAGFARVDSIELDVGRFLSGVKMFANEPRVFLHRGSSPDVLPEVLDPRLPTTVYLDAHYMGPGHGDPDPAYGECPLMAELDVVGRVRWETRPILVVDDWHLFRRPWEEDLLARFDPAQWPEAGAVLARLSGYEFVHTEFTLYAFPKG